MVQQGFRAGFALIVGFEDNQAAGVCHQANIIVGNFGRYCDVLWARDRRFPY